LPKDDTTDLAAAKASTGPAVAPGLHLPSTGRIWALDSFSGKPELLHVKYRKIDLNTHTGSNMLKTQAAPFLYKPKQTLEINGASAELRLHEASPIFFVRRVAWADQESADEAQTAANADTLSLLRLEVKSDHRVAATIAFTQVTSHASRSDSAIETVIEQIPGTDWYKLSPKQPLTPGEYGLMTLPKRQNTFGLVIYDFAIDAAAPENAGAVLAEQKNP
jgi:hypothetical protein